MTNTLSLLPLFAIIAVVGVLLIATVVFVQAAVRISHALSAHARAMEEIAASMSTTNRVQPR